jgi:serine/threonine protein kinase
VHLDLQPINLLVIENIEPHNTGYEHSQASDKNQSEKGKTSSAGSENSDSHRFIHLANFCISSGFQRKKFSSNTISSLYYMSPERICGELDVENEYLLQKADVWSVGVLLF